MKGKLKMYRFITTTLFLLLLAIPSISKADQSLCGDVNLDGSVNVLDSLAISQLSAFSFTLSQITALSSYAAGFITDEQKIASCLNADAYRGDGVINILDSLIVARMSAGLSAGESCTTLDSFCSAAPAMNSCFAMYGLDLTDLYSVCSCGPLSLTASPTAVVFDVQVGDPTPLTQFLNISDGGAMGCSLFVTLSFTPDPRWEILGPTTTLLNPTSPIQGYQVNVLDTSSTYIINTDLIFTYYTETGVEQVTVPLSINVDEQSSGGSGSGSKAGSGAGSSGAGSSGGSSAGSNR